jgi:hypothetical protein
VVAVHLGLAEEGAPVGRSVDQRSRRLRVDRVRFVPLAYL